MPCQDGQEAETRLRQKATSLSMLNRWLTARQAVHHGVPFPFWAGSYFSGVSHWRAECPGRTGLQTAAHKSKLLTLHGQTGSGKERLNQVRFLPQAPDSQMEFQMQLLQVHAR